MKRLALLSAAALLSACATPPPAPIVEVDTLADQPLAIEGQLEFNLASGTYHCERGLLVAVRRDATSSQLIHIAWTGGQHALHRNLSFSGLPRYEDATSGLVWIDLPWKGVLLDGRTNKPIVSECRMS